MGFEGIKGVGELSEALAGVFESLDVLGGECCHGVRLTDGMRGIELVVVFT